VNQVTFEVKHYVSPLRPFLNRQH